MSRSQRTNLSRNTHNYGNQQFALEIVGIEAKVNRNLLKRAKEKEESSVRKI